MLELNKSKEYTDSSLFKVCDSIIDSVIFKKPNLGLDFIASKVKKSSMTNLIQSEI